MQQIVGAVLAAGAGTRMGGPKADLVVDGQRLLDRAIHALRDGGCAGPLAVVRAGTHVPNATAVVNAQPGAGMRSSLQLACDAAAALDADAMLVIPVDRPGIDAAAVSEVRAAWQAGRIAVGSYGEGALAHPIVMGLASWRAGLTVAGADEGARRFIAANPELVDCVTLRGDPRDLDDPADLAAWTARLS